MTPTTIKDLEYNELKQIRHPQLRRLLSPNPIFGELIKLIDIGLKNQEIANTYLNKLKGKISRDYCYKLLFKSLGEDIKLEDSEIYLMEYDWISGSIRLMDVFVGHNPNFQIAYILISRVLMDSDEVINQHLRDRGLQSIMFYNYQT